MKQGPEQPEDKYPFDESLIPEKVKSYFDSFDRDAHFWSRDSLQKARFTNTEFVVQLWFGLLHLVTKLSEESDEHKASKYDRIRDAARVTFSSKGDDIDAVLGLYTALKDTGVDSVRLAPSETLKAAYLDAARAYARVGLDPKERLPFRYGRMLPKPPADTSVSAPRERESFDGGVDSGKGDEWKRRLQREVSLFSRLAPEAAADLSLGASQPVQGEEVPKSGPDFLDQLIEEMKKDSNAVTRYFLGELELKPGEKPNKRGRRKQ